MTPLLRAALALVAILCTAVPALAASEAEQLLIQRHLEQVEDRLRSVDASHLSADQRSRRALHLDRLQAYRLAARFPVQARYVEDPEPRLWVSGMMQRVTPRRVPVFVDHRGTRCAVGHLLDLDGKQDFVLRVSRERNLGYVLEMPYPEIGFWATDNGFEIEELAMIQPAYGWEDADLDGLSDDYEWYIGTDPFDSDTDDDGLLDGFEINEWVWPPTDTDSDGLVDPLDADDDGDGIPTEAEWNVDMDGDGFANIDIDGDGLLNHLDLDSDGDGIADAEETDSDPDGDEVPNYADLDSDGDSVEDLVEGAVDSDGDGFDDYLDRDSDDDGSDDSEDCARTDAAVFPDADDIPDDGIDQDCSGADTVRCYEDLDGDGFGTTVVRFAADGLCAEPGEAVDSGDCDDSDPATFPDSEELCDGLDNDCDGELPDDEVDADGDGLGACDGDCDDDDPSVHPDAADLCDGVDNDCDGVVDDCSDSIGPPPVVEPSLITGDGDLVGCGGCALHRGDSAGSSWLSLLLLWLPLIAGQRRMRRRA